MKSIVDYLTEHKAYNEIKGRKMWVDFERSKVSHIADFYRYECFIDEKFTIKSILCFIPLNIVIKTKYIKIQYFKPK